MGYVSGMLGKCLGDVGGMTSIVIQQNPWSIVIDLLKFPILCSSITRSVSLEPPEARSLVAQGAVLNTTTGTDAGDTSDYSSECSYIDWITDSRTEEGIIGKNCLAEGYERQNLNTHLHSMSPS